VETGRLGLNGKDWNRPKRNLKAPTKKVLQSLLRLPKIVVVFGHYVSRSVNDETLPLVEINQEKLRVYEAASLSGINSKLLSELPRSVIVTRKEPVHDVALASAQFANRPIRHQIVRGTNSKLVGILLCHPGSPLAKSEILSHLPYFHVRSGDAIDFFCAGYGAYWPPEYYADQAPVARIQDQEWLFSDIAFNEVIEELEIESKWKYSGETELLLIPAMKTSDGHISFVYETTGVFNLEKMANDKAFTSVRAFFGDIIRFAKSNSSNDPSWVFSDRKGLEVAARVLKEGFLSLVPEPLRSGYSTASHYAVSTLPLKF
jgi:hypothetical protein